MKPVRICIALAVILAPYSLPGPTTSQPKPPEIDAATQLFQAGKFTEAGKLYSRLVTENSQDYAGSLHWTAPDFPEAILVEDYAAILGSSRVA